MHERSEGDVWRIAMQMASSNPYVELLAGALADRGHVVEPLGIWTVAAKPPDIIHIHWPERFVEGGIFKRSLKSLLFLVIIGVAYLRRTSVVVTIHNAEPHERRGTVSEGVVAIIIRMANGVITLSHAGMEAGVAKYPFLRNRPSSVISHGHYKDTCDPAMTQQKARARLDISLANKYMLYFGMIRSYKGVPDLIRAFSDIRDNSWVLRVVGEPRTTEMENQVRTEADVGAGTHIDLRLVEEAELHYYIHGSDLVVLPYRSVLHSGAAMLALSLNRPVLAPALGSLPELQEEVGPLWVRLYDPPLTSDDLDEACEWASETRGEVPVIRSWEWDVIADKTLELYIAAKEHRWS